jgi:excisionase family DNA binding protein
VSALDRKWTVQALAAKWGCSVKRIYRLVEHHDPKERLPHERIGGRICFEEDELERWLEPRRHRSPVASEPKTPARADADRWAEEPGAERYVH